MALPPTSLTQPLDARHVLTDFDCGEPALIKWLPRFALANQRNDSSKTRVVTDDQQRVLGYYSLAVGSVQRDDVADRIGHGLARYPVPVVILTRLAVDKRYQRRGLGRSLLSDALKMVAAVSDAVGVRALLIHVKTDAARDWYLQQAEFEASPVAPHQLFLLIKDLRKAAGKTT